MVIKFHFQSNRNHYSIYPSVIRFCFLKKINLSHRSLNVALTNYPKPPYVLPTTRPLYSIFILLCTTYLQYQLILPQQMVSPIIIPLEIHLEKKLVKLWTLLIWIVKFNFFKLVNWKLQNFTSPK